MSCPNCPTCKSEMTFIGSCGILDYDGRWHTEAERFRCTPCDVMVFVASSASTIDQQEEESADDMWGVDHDNH